MLPLKPLFLQRQLTPRLPKKDQSDGSDEVLDRAFATKLRWLSAEFNHVQLKAKGWKGLAHTLTELLAKPKFAKLAIDFLVRYGKHDPDVKLKVGVKVAKIIAILKEN